MLEPDISNALSVKNHSHKPRVGEAVREEKMAMPVPIPYQLCALTFARDQNAPSCEEAQRFGDLIRPCRNEDGCVAAPVGPVADEVKAGLNGRSIVLH